MLSQRRSPVLGLLSLLLLVALPAFGFPDQPIPLAPGTAYQRIYRPEGPWAVNVVEVELPQELVELRALLGGGGTTGRQAVAQMLAAHGSEERRPVAAVNADYFALAGWGYTTLPLGFHIQNGELVTLPDAARSVLYLLADGTAHIGRFRSNSWLVGPDDLLFPLSGVNRPPERGDLTLLTPRFGKETRTGEEATQLTLDSLSGPVQPNVEVTARIASIRMSGREPIPEEGAVLLASGVAAYAVRNLKVGDEVRLRLAIEPDVGKIEQAIGGGPRLVREGRVSVEHRQERFGDRFASQLHPRTGVGLRDRTLVMVTVDGRQPGYSVGMTLSEFAELFVELGCSDAMNLDGGGSTTMVVRDRVVNSPSDGWPRGVANALALFTTAPKGPPVRLAIAPAEVTLLCGERVPLAAVGLDEYFNEVPLEAESVQWDCSTWLGSMDATGTFCGADVKYPLAGLVAARWKDLTASVVVRVLPAPARLAITPGATALKPGAVRKFTVRAFDEENHPVQLPVRRVTWEVTPASAGAAIDTWGVLKAPVQPARLMVTARVGEVSAQAEVLVGMVTTIIADFERPDGFSFRGIPEGVTGEVTAIEDPLNKANHCLRLKYDLSGATGTRVGNVQLDLPLPETRTISLRVLGDGQGAWLRARLRDGIGRPFTVDLADQVDWAGRWRRVTGWVPEEATQPATLESIYITEYHADRRPVGEIYLDDIGVAALSDGGRAVKKPEEARETESADKAGEKKTAEKRVHMGELPSYVCRRTREGIVIDGQLDEPVWSKASAVADFRLVDGSGEPQLPTELKICWDDSNLYLGFVCIDTNIWGTYRKRDDPLWEEEVVEAFLSSGGEVTKYFEFNFSPHNVVFDARIEIPESGDRDLMKSDVGWNCEGMQSAVHVVGTLDDDRDIDQRWTVEVALPFSQIGGQGQAPKEGERWRANFYRIDRAGEGESSCWSPTLVPNFHVPGRFGHLIFSTEAW